MQNDKKRMKKKIFEVLVCLVFAVAAVGCGARNSQEQKGVETEADSVNVALGKNDGRFVKVDTLENLVVYTPVFSSIDLACGEMPSKEYSSVIFCAAAAFTGSFLSEFKHSNIAGDHVSGGKRFEGFDCRVNTGCFVYYGNKEWDFVYEDYSHALDSAASTGGMGFAQIMMINDGKVKQTYRTNPKNTRDVNEFRALCELNGNLCVIDSRGFVNFIDFVNDLAAAGVSDAKYMDMGEGWNYSWWRHSDGTAVEIHETPCAYTTNWIAFYK